MTNLNDSSKILHDSYAKKRLLPIVEILDDYKEISFHQSVKKLAAFLYNLTVSYKFKPFEISQAWIAKKLCYTRQHINKTLMKLEKLELVKIIRSGIFKQTHKYIFMFPQWLINIVSLLPKNEYYFATMSSEVTQSDNKSNIYNINNNNNNNNCVISNNSDNNDDRGTKKVINYDLKRSEPEKSAGIENMRKIKDILKKKSSENKNENGLDEENRELKINLSVEKQEFTEEAPPLTCTDPIKIKNHIDYLIKNNEIKKSEHYKLILHRIESVNEKFGTNNVKQNNDDLKSNYNPCYESEELSNKIKNKKEKTKYLNQSDLPLSMRQKIKRVSWECLNRTQETDVKELSDQIEFSIIGNLENSDVKYGVDPLDHSFNRVMKILREGKWSRPYGYIDRQSRLARSNEKEHLHKKNIEIQSNKKTNSYINNITNLLKPIYSIF